MANSQKEVKINRNSADKEFSILEEIKTILKEILPKETVSEIIKVLPMYPDSTRACNFSNFLLIYI